jgi:uncharacterized cupredoxin-like copper-binding protein
MARAYRKDAWLGRAYQVDMEGNRTMIARLKLVFAAALLASPIAAPAQPADFSQAQVVEGSLSNFHFAPSDIHLRAGQPVILRLTNTSSGGHDFDAAQFFAAATVRPADMGAIHNGEVEVGSHQSVDIGLVPTAGRFALKCTHPFHAVFGMKGTITVD